MNELVFKSSKGNPVTTSIIVAEIFDKEHNKVCRDIENLSCSEEFRAANFGVSSYKSVQNKKLPMYYMTKDGFSFLVMGYTGSKAGQFKESFIKAFNLMDAKLRNSVPVIPGTFAEALELAAHQAREIEKKDKLIAIQSPKAELADRLIDTETRVDIGQAAKLLKLPFGRNTFFKALREMGIFFKNRNEPKQEYIDRGYFEMYMVLIPTEHHGDLSSAKIIVTQKGLSWLAKIFGVNYNPSLPNLNTTI